MRLAYTAEQPSENVKALATMIVGLLVDRAGSYSEAESALEEAQRLLSTNTKPVIAAPHADD